LNFSKVVYRKEYDTFGEIEVPEEKLWGAQTQRSLQNFEIGTKEDKMPLAIIRAMAIIKKSCAKVNMESYGLKSDIGNAIINAANEVIIGKHNSQFPLVIFQTGSGTQSNMNTNEVLANRSSELLGGERGKECLVNPNDHVNKGQSSNDTYPTAMHIAIAVDLNNYLYPDIKKLHSVLIKKSIEYKDIIKIGRTHTQDATPLTLGQEISGYEQQVENHLSHLQYASKYIYKLAQGGTAVGTGLNTTEGYDKNIAKQIAQETGLPFETAENKFEALATKDAICNFHGSLNSFASSLFKIANDLKLLSGDLKELKIGCADTCEEVMMNCVQVMGNHQAITVGSKLF
jgi:fumarate hydratase class II